MTADLQAQAYANEVVRYMALELSSAKWRMAFGDGTGQRQVVIAAGDVASLREQLTQLTQLVTGTAKLNVAKASVRLVRLNSAANARIASGSSRSRSG